MRGGVDAAGEPAHHTEAPPGQFGAKFPGDRLSVKRRPAAAHDRDARMFKGIPALPVEADRRIVNLAEQLRVVLVTRGEEGRAGLGGPTQSRAALAGHG